METFKGIEHMDSFLEYVVSAIVGVAILGSGLFFTAFPGGRFLQVRAQMRKLRAELEPVARAVGAKTKTEWVTEKGQVMYFVELQNEEWLINNGTEQPSAVKPWITLEVSPSGFNVYVPTFSPPREHSPDFEALVRAVHRLRSANTAD